MYTMCTVIHCSIGRYNINNYCCFGEVFTYKSLFQCLHKYIPEVKSYNIFYNIGNSAIKYTHKPIHHVLNTLLEALYTKHSA